MKQINLFETVCEAFASSPEGVSTKTLYARAERAGLNTERRTPIGRAGVPYSPVKRSIRWIQQTLKKLGIAEAIPQERGSWRLTDAGRKKLCPAQRGVALVACRTDLGLALWAHHEDVFARLDEPITLCLTSPPYPLARPRAYGGPTQSEYVDFICTALEPITRSLRAGGSIVLNISNDIFEPKSPARSLYRERLVIALHERLGLHKMDEFVWENPSKPPGPTHWSSINRFHLTSTWEPVLWFCNAPLKCFADNRRVLVPHKAAQSRLIERGGAQRAQQFGDGAYKLREHSYSNPTAGAIPRNVLRYQHNCPDKTRVAAIAKQLGLPVHGATMPLSLAEFLVRYLSDLNDLVVDPFAGWFTTAMAAQNSGRRWLVTELMEEYARIATWRISNSHD